MYLCFNDTELQNMFVNVYTTTMKYEVVTPLLNTTWQHVGFTWHPTTGLEVLVDGTLAGTDAGTAAIRNVPSTNNIYLAHNETNGYSTVSGH